MKILGEIAKSEPQSAYSCFVSRFKHKLNYVMRKIPDIFDTMQQVNNLIRTEFIQAVTGGKMRETNKMLLSLPPKLGALSIPIFSLVYY